jgi:hypothetical protein
MPYPGKTPGKTYIFIRKYQKKTGNIFKHQEIPEILGNIRKYYEYKTKNMKY